MLSKTIEDALNIQLKVEAESSHVYLAMASWAETKGLPGIAKFLFSHSEEERQHMMKLLNYINDRGGHAVISELLKPQVKFDSIPKLFKELFDHEVRVSEAINKVVDVCLKEKDYTTHNFMQWYVSEQIEEESMARTLLDKLELIGDNKSGLYLFDNDVATMHEGLHK